MARFEPSKQDRQGHERKAAQAAEYDDRASSDEQKEGRRDDFQSEVGLGHIATADTGNQCRSGGHHEWIPVRLAQVVGIGEEVTVQDLVGLGNVAQGNVSANYHERALLLFQGRNLAVDIPKPALTVNSKSECRQSRNDSPNESRLEGAVSEKPSKIHSL
jgi:hypothetical protein